MQRITLIVTLLYGLTISPLAYPEFIDGPANIRKSPGGEVIFRLLDKTQIATDESGGEWLPIFLEVSANKNNIENGKLKPNTKIFDLVGKIVGETKRAIVMSDSVEIDSNRLRGKIEGWIYKNNFKRFPLLNNRNLIIREGLYVNKVNVNRKNKTFTLDINPIKRKVIDSVSVKHTSKGYEINLFSTPDIEFKLVMNKYGALESYPCVICENIKMIEVKSPSEMIVTTEQKKMDILINVEGYKFIGDKKQ